MPQLHRVINRIKICQSYDARDIELCINMLSKSHIFREDIPSLYGLLILPVPENVKCLAFLGLRSVDNEWQQLDLLAALLKCKEETAELLLTAPIIEVTFPVIKQNSEGEAEAVLSLAIIVELNEESVFLDEKKEHDLRRIAKITGKPFFVLFANSICDRSYMLAITAGLVLQDKSILSGLSFTGTLSDSGEIKSVDHLPAKQLCCRNHHRKLICGDFSLNTMVSWLEKDPIPIPLSVMFGFAAKEGLEKLSATIEQVIRQRYSYFSFKNLELFQDLKPDELFIIDPNDLSNNGTEWLSLINDRIEPMIDTIRAKSPSGRRELQVFGSISSIMFAAGLLISDKASFTAWHYIQGRYYPVISTANRPRSIKKRDEFIEYQKIVSEVTDPQEQMKITLFLASHNMLSATSRYVQEVGIKAGSIHIKSCNNQGDLPVDEDWTDYVNEIYNLFNQLIDDYGIKKFHLFLGCPVSIAFAMGAAFGRYWDIDVYQLDRQNKTYFKVFSVRDL